jgi:hypothetical protein
VTRSEIEKQVRGLAAAEGQGATAGALWGVNAAGTVLLWALEILGKKVEARVRVNVDVAVVMLGEPASPLESPVIPIAHSRNPSEGLTERPLVANLLRPCGDMDLPHLCHELGSYDHPR